MTTVGNNGRTIAPTVSKVLPKGEKKDLLLICVYNLGFDPITV